jgi:hypothetical protein
MKLSHLFLVGAGLLLLSPVTYAQFGGAAIFEPEIDIVNSGAILDAQATVSADRKYVTMTLRPQNTQLLSIQTFTFQTAGAPLPGGTVGGVNPVIPGPGGAPAAVPDRINPAARVRPGHGGAILLRRGVTPLILE